MEATVDIHTFQQGKIGRYAPANEFRSFWVIDYDKDGRLALLIQPYAELNLRFPGQWGCVSQQRSLLAHSLNDGTFSLTDSVAVQFAKDLRPVTPAPFSGHVNHVGPRNPLQSALGLPIATLSAKLNGKWQHLEQNPTAVPFWNVPCAAPQHPANAEDPASLESLRHRQQRRRR